jgi:membrane protein YdbS with pleckstrin-like domain
MLVFVLALVCARAFVEDKSLLKGFLVLLSPIPFLGVALFFGASGMWNYALLLIFVITLIRFAVIIPSLRRMTQKQNTKV